MTVEHEGAMGHSRRDGGPQVKDPFARVPNATPIMPPFPESNSPGSHHHQSPVANRSYHDDLQEPGSYHPSPHKAPHGSSPHGGGPYESPSGGGGEQAHHLSPSPDHGGGGGGHYVEDEASHDPSGIVEGPRRILDPDQRMIRSKQPPPAEFEDPQQAPADVGAPEALEGAVVAEAEGLVDMFGEEVARMIYSKQWQHREEGLRRVLAALPQADRGRAGKVVSQVNKKGLNDKNPAVYMQALNLFKASAKLTDETGRPLEVKGVFDQVMPVLVNQLSNNNVRVKDETHKALMQLSSEPSAGCAYVCQFALKPPKQANNPKVILTRLELIDQMMGSHELSSANGLTPDTIMPICNLGMNSTNADTRNKAISVTEKVFKSFNGRFDPYKGVESEATRKILKEKLGGGGGGAPPAAAPKPRAPPPGGAGGGAKKTPSASSPGSKPAGGPPPKKAPPAKAAPAPSEDEVEPEDDGDKVDWYRRKADQGDADAQYNLAVCYDEGKGVAQDLKEAAKWFQKAADQGDGDAQFSLGVCYHEGKGVAKDDAKAIELWTKSAKQDNADAQFILGWSSNQPPE
mmetsp:Transcript_42301/g.103306  ORF Transcript_42301/g.103306 Transcript_42301/m.103306 type:complete len:573 (-) Transcript_42301:125-1843(-)